MIAPESVIHELSRYRKVYVSELKNPAPNRICYKIKHKYPKTTSKRAVELLKRFWNSFFILNARRSRLVKYGADGNCIHIFLFH